MSSSVPVAGLSHVTKRFDAVVALRDVSIDFHGGSVHALLGENGGGKSTCVKVLSGALRPDHGTVTIDGRPVVLHGPRAGINAGIATSYQDSALVSQLSVASNIVLGHEPGGPILRMSQSVEVAQRWLAVVGLDVDPRERVADLPVASQQLVAIAKALSLDARVFIFDEPTAALTQDEVERLFSLIDSLRTRGLAIVYITHRLAEVERLADVITVLKDGHVARTLPAEGATEDTIVPLMVGREVRNLFPVRTAPRDEVVLEARNLCSADGSVSVDELLVRAGEIVGIAGLDGSGRSALAQLLTGVARGQGDGAVKVDGKRLRSGVRAALRSGVGYTPPDRRRQATIPTFTVRRSITYASLRRFTVAGFLSPRLERHGATPFLARLDVRPPRLDVPIRTLSGGNQQKVVLARVLCAGTRVLVCDEPTAGVDVGAREEIYALLGQLAADGMAIVASSSDMLELLGLCHRIVVMREGRLVAEFDPTVTDEEALMRAQLPERRWSAA